MPMPFMEPLPYYMKQPPMGPPTGYDGIDSRMYMPPPPPMMGGKDDGYYLPPPPPPPLAAIDKGPSSSSVAVEDLPPPPPPYQEPEKTEPVEEPAPTYNPIMKLNIAAAKKIASAIPDKSK
eukprot:CAMPEP_0168318262 /NCGR_PEP_ID=MMETSP0213-20121227/375_1 /TAXON_ID=151035 /ORGANISM="Euplotes harpa, Strain FSP1.4" /LENGTH=120 /DNA_ID=CAMNT_0008319297 /DNA_START=214 /DNA_END=573 /DNA_ORIENTATION=-